MPQAPAAPTPSNTGEDTAVERHVFVYGTLRRGGRNDINRLQPAPRFVGAAQVRGRLYSLGWYPGLTLDPSAGPVHGEVYAITPALEAVLDRIEHIEDSPHSEYFRRHVPVRVDGRELQCLVYEVNPERVRALSPLPTDDWMAFHSS